MISVMMRIVASNDACAIVVNADPRLPPARFTRFHREQPPRNKRVALHLATLLDERPAHNHRHPCLVYSIKRRRNNAPIQIPRACRAPPPTCHSRPLHCKRPSNIILAQCVFYARARLHNPWLRRRKRSRQPTHALCERRPPMSRSGGANLRRRMRASSSKSLQALPDAMIAEHRRHA